MHAAPPQLSAADAYAQLQAAQQCIGLLQGEVTTLRAQLEWFRRQIFGQKSERYAWHSDGLQLHLGDIFRAPQSAGTDTANPAPTPTPQVIAPHQRHKPLRDFAPDGQEIDSFFDAARVAMHTIEVPNPALHGLRPEQYEVVGYKHSHRLAQQSGAYSVLRYRRTVIKRLDTGTLHCPPAPEGVLQGSRADVSLVAGLVVDKIAYYLPLYRQHQRLIDAGFKLSRAWLTQLVQSAAALLAPIYEAQLASVLHSRVLCMDETPIKAGRNMQSSGKMHTGYLWPMPGEQREVCFAYCTSREHRHVHELLGRGQRADRILVCDGYQAYASYAQATQITRAQCWVHYPESLFIQTNLTMRTRPRVPSLSANSA